MIENITMKSKQAFQVIGIVALASVLVFYTLGYLDESGSEQDAIVGEPETSVGNPTNRESNSQPISAIQELIYSGVPPYLVELPILEGELYVKHASDKFHFGGQNLHQVQYSASIRSGGIPTISDRDGYIEFLTTEQPYIEFHYNGKYYSIRVNERSYSTVIEILEISSASVELDSKFGN